MKYLYISSAVFLFPVFGESTAKAGPIDVTSLTNNAQAFFSSVFEGADFGFIEFKQNKGGDGERNAHFRINVDRESLFNNNIGLNSNSGESGIGNLSRVKLDGQISTDFITKILPLDFLSRDLGNDADPDDELSLSGSVNFARFLNNEQFNNDVATFEAEYRFVNPFFGFLPGDKNRKKEALSFQTTQTLKVQSNLGFGSNFDDLSRSSIVFSLAGNAINIPLSANKKCETVIPGQSGETGSISCNVLNLTFAPSLNLAANNGATSDSAGATIGFNFEKRFDFKDNKDGLFNFRLSKLGLTAQLNGQEFYRNDANRRDLDLRVVGSGSYPIAGGDGNSIDFSVTYQNRFSNLAASRFDNVTFAVTANVSSTKNVLDFIRNIGR